MKKSIVFIVLAGLLLLAGCAYVNGVSRGESHYSGNGSVGRGTTGDSSGADVGMGITGSGDVRR